MARNEYCLNCCNFCDSKSCPHYWEIVRAAKARQRDGWGNHTMRSCSEWSPINFWYPTDNYKRLEELYRD